MKKLLSSLFLISFSVISCTNVSYYEPSERNISIDDPEIMAYLHNASLSRFFSGRTKAGDLPSNQEVVSRVCEIVLDEADKIGLHETISADEIEFIDKASSSQIAQFSGSVDSLVEYYISLFPFSEEIKCTLYELSMNDILTGSTTFLEYMNGLNTGTKVSNKDAAYIAQFCAIGNASKQFWQQQETKGWRDMTSRDWLATGADIAGSFLAGGIIGVIISTVFSLNMGFADVMSLEDAMNTNCD